MSTSPLDFEAVFRATDSSYAILDPAFVIVDVNDAFLRGAGRSRDDLVGVCVFDAFPDDPDDPEATGSRDLRASLERAVRARAPDRMPMQKYAIRTGGVEEGRFEERFWRATNTPMFDAGGALTHIIHRTEDITEQVTADKAMRESEHRFRALTNATADVIYRMSPDWSQMRELDGRGFLKTTEAAGEYRLEDYVPPEDQAMGRAAIEAAIRDKAVFVLEHRVLRPGRSPGWTYSRAVPILDADGGIVEWIGAASDITERKEAEERLKDADRRKDEFLAMLAHELRNPLAPISAAASLLQLGTLDEARLRTTSQVIARQARHMTRLVDDLLDVSRVTRGLIRIDTAALDLHDVVAEAVEQVAPLIGGRRHRLDLRLSAEPVMVAGDRKRLVQLLANLLNNAAKFTPEGGRLEVTTEAAGPHVRLEVADDGIGMTPDMAEHAFDLFSQAERSADRASGGLGLGLALVRSLAALHGGTASCRSDGPGRGSTFTVCLPRLTDGRTGEPEAAAGTAPAAPHGGLHILVVDDNVDAAATLAMLLDTMGHRVAVEHGPHAALERALRDAPQVCLLDIGLPGMDGNELARRLRAHPATARAVLVALSGYGQPADRARALAAGFDHYLVKPVDAAQLAAVLLTASAAA
jgi:PAS domain S-box-containing protein